MTKDFVLQEYLMHGVQDICRDILRASVKDPKETLFMAGFVKAAERALRRRERAAQRGEQIPPS